MASQVTLMVKNLPAIAGDIREIGSIPGPGRSPGERHGNPLQYSCLENPMYREEPDGLWSKGWQRVTHNWVTKHSYAVYIAELSLHEPHFEINRRVPQIFFLSSLSHKYRLSTISSSTEISFKWLVLKLPFIISGNQIRCPVQRLRMNLNRFADFDGHYLKEKFLHISFLSRLDFSLLVVWLQFFLLCFFPKRVL